MTERRTFALLLLAATLIAGFARFHRLEDPSFWSDEMFQIRSGVIGALPGYRETQWALALTGVDTGALEPEGYAQWKSQGITEWNARLAAALIGTLTIPLLALLSAPFLGRPAALLLGLFLAVHPWHLEWSQSARFYAPMFLYFNGALVLYLAHALRPSPWKLCAAMGLAFLAVGTKPTSLMLFGVIGIDLLHQLARSRKLPSATETGILAAGGAISLYLAAAPLLAAPADTTAFIERSPAVSPPRLWAENLYYTGLPMGLLACAGFVLLWRSRPRVAVFLASCVAVPLVAFGVLTLMTSANVRYTFVSLYGWTALAAAGAWGAYEAARPHLPRIAAALPIAMALATLLLADLVYSVSAYGNRPRFRHAFEYIGEHRAPGEDVIAHSSWVGEYYLEDPEIRHVDIDFEGLESIRRPTWFLVRSTDYELDEGRPHWLDPEADLRAVFPTRTAFPQSTLRVYYYEPETPGRR